MSEVEKHVCPQSCTEYGAGFAGAFLSMAGRPGNFAAAPIIRFDSIEETIAR